VIFAFWFAWWIFCFFSQAILIGVVADTDSVFQIFGVIFWGGIIVIPIVFGWLWMRRV
jgi:hypothetical protein